MDFAQRSGVQGNYGVGGICIGAPLNNCQKIHILNEIQNRPYAFEWGERVLILGGEGRLGQVTPPAWRSTRSR